MKKIASVCLFALMAAISAFGLDVPGNLQKIYPVDSEVYEAIRYLYIDQGFALPSTTGPWSGDELAGMLERIDPAKLEGGAKATYEFALSSLGEGKKAVKFGLKTTVEGYYHRDTANFTKESEWIRGFDKRNPILDIILETWPSEHFYGYSSLPVGHSRFNGWNASEGDTSTLWGQSALTTNIPLLAPAVLTDLDFNVPYRAFGSIGGKGWSAEIGRDKYSWGPGESGNFVLGDHFLYHNMGRLTSYGKNFKYTFATSFFPHPSSYYPFIDGTTGAYNNWGSQDDNQTGLYMFIGHRLEGRLFKDKVGLALTEAVMYESPENSLDLRVLSPTAIFHNYYIRNNGNSMLSLEVDFSPIRYLNIYGQVGVDEFYLPGEPVPGVSADALPSAFAFMAGAKTSVPFGTGMFFGSAEWAKTDPYLYIRDNGSRNQAQGDYGLSWIAAIREFSQAGISYTEDFLGYKYGGDAIVYNVKAGYKKFGRWSAEANFLYMIHGTHDLWTTWGNQNDATQDTETTPTTTHVTTNNADLDADERDSASYTFVIGARGSYKIIKGLEVFGQVDYIHIRNPGNLSANPPISDVQVTAGISYKL
ncbi:MAG TPA: hypothetical protein VIO60_08470 [Rectinemataceae bacterium]